MPGINDRYSRFTRIANQNENLPEMQFSRAFDKLTTALCDRRQRYHRLDRHDRRLGASRQLPAGRIRPGTSPARPPSSTSIRPTRTPPGRWWSTIRNHVIAACDTPGDNDWFAVTLTAGVTYQFGQYAYVGGIPGVEGNGVALADAYLEIYDSAGNLLSIADGGGPNTPSGLDALMTFQATYSGTYYVNATSYDNTGDGVGDFAGDYEIFARTATGTLLYHAL